MVTRRMVLTAAPLVALSTAGCGVSSEQSRDFSMMAQAEIDKDPSVASGEISVICKDYFFYAYNNIQGSIEIAPDVLLNPQIILLNVVKNCITVLVRSGALSEGQVDVTGTAGNVKVTLYQALDAPQDKPLTIKEIMSWS